MRLIYKYRLPICDYPVITLPKGAQILSVGEQNGGLHVWALMDDEEKDFIYKKFRIFGTGNPVVSLVDLKFINTIISRTGFVWHVFEEV